MNIESHRILLKESLHCIERSIQEGIDKNQRNIGFNASAAAIDMLEIYLHVEGHLALSASIQHDWFASKRKAMEKVKVDFPNKEKIIGLIAELESKRNILVYGKQQPKPYVEEYLNSFNAVKEHFEDLGVENE